MDILIKLYKRIYRAFYIRGVIVVSFINFIKSIGMALIIAGAFIIILFFMIFSRSRKTTAQKIVALQKGWGQVKDEQPGFDFVSAYSMFDKSISFHELTDQTMSDIDFHALFHFVDRTTGKPGQQYLYNLLKKPTDDIADLEQRNNHANFFAENQRDREYVQLLLLSLEKHDAYYIVNLLEDRLFPRPRWITLLLMDTLLVIIMLFLSPFFPVLLIWLMLPFAINLFLHFRNKNNTYRFIKSFPQLNTLINISKKLIAKDLPTNTNKQAVADSIQALKSFQFKFSILNFGQSNGSDMGQVAWFFVEIFKSLFLVEIHTFYSLVDGLQKRQKEIDQLFRFIGYTDTCLSIASLRSGLTCVCVPGFIPAQKKMHAESIYHPLISNCIPNMVDIDGRSILITGSNMSGKTSFLRTVAVNSLLAQTLYTCFAKSFQAPVFKLFSSIRIDDSLLEGKSYYFEEVNVMHTLVEQVNCGYQCLFILDEVFKGTNTVERIASGKAILSYLNKGNHIVLVATHDIELSAMLDKEYDLYHFSEHVQQEELIFDHILKAGPLTTRNAIKILELAKYPVEIIREAQELSGNLNAKRNH